MTRSIAAPLISVLLAGCEPSGGWEYKECRLSVSELPAASDMGGDERLKYIDQCMAKKGLRPTATCTAAGAQGKPHCEYEQVPAAPSFRW